jgi:hypothetical protein
MNEIHQYSYRERSVGTMVVVLATACACSSAQFDRNSGAFRFYTQSPSASSVAGAGPQSSTPVRNGSSARSASSAAGAGSQPNTPSRLRRAAPPAGVSGAAGSPAAEPRLPACSSLPDPKPLRTDRWVELLVHFDHGVADITGAESHRTRQAADSPRKMGRFAVELWIGCELLDRVRFDFPLLSAESTREHPSDPNFEAAAHLQTKILVPDSDRATRLELIDRAKNTRKVIVWPIAAKLGTP